MITETIKRWLILSGLLAITIWLALNVPEPKKELVGVNSVRTATQSDNIERRVTMNNAKSEQEALFSLIQRPSLSEKTIDLFGYQQQKQSEKLIKPIIKPIIQASAKPKAPSLPFSYIGKMVEGNVTKVFLLEGQALHIVSKGDKVGEYYQLKHVGDQQLSWLYLPLNITQQMSIGKAP